MEKKWPAILLPAFSRPASFSRLLDSIDNADYPSLDIPLVISLEGNRNRDLDKIAREFDWNNGPLIIRENETRLGLKEHMLALGDLTREYGSVIVLEEDLVVSEGFYHYAIAARDFYQEDSRVAGISLYHYRISENCNFPFDPVQDGSDVYFLQAASSWGQLWSRPQWRGFRKWLKEYPEMEDTDGWPDYLGSWPDYSWKKHFSRYLAHSGKYFVYPRGGYSTPFAEGGISPVVQNLYQTPLVIGNREFRFSECSRSIARYDPWFEWDLDCLKSKCLALPDELEINDLHGTKILPESDALVLSTRPTQAPVRQWGMKMVPPELNLLYGVEGGEISMAPARSFRKDKTPSFLFNYTQHELWSKQFDDISAETWGDLGIRPASLSVTVKILATEENIGGLADTLATVPTHQFSRLVPVIFCEEALRNHSMVSDLPWEICFVKGKSSQAADLFREAFAADTGDICTIVEAGTLFEKRTFHYIPFLFQFFGDLGWLTGSNGPRYEKGATGKAWSVHLFQRRLRKRKNQMEFPVTFWRSFGNQIFDEIWTELEEVEFAPAAFFAGMFSFADLETVEIPLVKNQGPGFRKKGTWQIGKVMEKVSELQHKRPGSPVAEKLFFPFINMNLPYLRGVYREFTALPQVIRWDSQWDSFYRVNDYLK